MAKQVTLEEWLDNNQLGIDIWRKKYQNNEESFDSWLDRVSGGNQDVRNLILEKKFLFGGRILANRNVKSPGVTYSNCYVLSVKDSIEDIYKCCSEMARTFSYGGGVGIDISNLRPKGAHVNNSAKETTGAVSFMKTFDTVTETIGQHGRRGALMVSIDINHPDVVDFINIKANTDNITHANISVRVNDEFMKAVELDKDYILKWPCDSPEIFKHPELFDYNVLVKQTDMLTPNSVTYFKKIKARELFMQIARNNWDYAEPGVLYWDRISSWHMMSENPGFEYAGVNPCLAGDSLIQTVEGEIPIKDLVGTTPFVYCMDEYGNLTIKKAIKVWKTRENASLVEVISGKGRLICTPDHRIYTVNRGWVEAKDLHKGDKIKGLNRQTTGHKYCAVGLSGTKYEKEHRFVARHFYDISEMDVHHVNDNGFDNRLSNLEVISHEEHSKLSNTGRIIEVERDPETGRYLPKETHTSRNCQNLGKEVGTNWFVTEVRELDYTEDVYDMTVEDTHNFIANGFVVHNCAEEPLPDGGACLLGSMNISKYVVKGKFQTEQFWNDVQIATRALNEVLEEGMNLHPLKVQREAAAKYHQIGLGLFDLGGALIKLGIKYGSDKAKSFAEHVTREMLLSAFKTSCDINYSKEKPVEYPGLFESKFYKEQIEPYLDKDYLGKYPYNSQLLTIAPTGTISTMVDAASGGGEPMFALEYFRTTKSLHDKDVTYKVYPKIVREYFGDEEPDLTKLPNFFITSENIDWKDRIEMQGALQQYIDASISSTVNLPENTTVNDVFNLYMYAWKQGLKGVTIFRSNCKRVAILSTTNTPESKPTEVIKRPKQLEATCYTLKASGENFAVMVGTYDGKPYEVFCQRLNNNEKTGKTYKGILVKNKKMDYSFISDEFVIEHIGENVLNNEERATTLYISMLLRHNADIKYIIKTARKVDNTIVSFTAAICRVLSKYIPEGSSGEKCPECGGELTMDGGCRHCQSCGYSACLFLKRGDSVDED